MKLMTIGRLCLAASFIALINAGGVAVAAPIEQTAAVVQDGAVSRAVGVTVMRLDKGVRVLVDGLAYQDVTAWDSNGWDISGALQGAVADGSAAVHPSAAGFELEWQQPPADLGLEDGRLGVRAAAVDGVVASAAPISCPTSVPFGWPTSPTKAATANCQYGSATCLQSGKRHTGIDYAGAGNAIAIAAGKVVRVETMNASDHGMGTNLLVRHILPGPNCAIVYSGYAHLASLASGIAVNKVVTKGQTLGVIGGSGNGKPNAFAPHLHLEMKPAAVTGNPFGIGNQTKTCATGSLNAKANTCWRYVGTAASSASAPYDYGYLNPAGYLNKTLTVPVYRQVSMSAAHTCAVKADNTLACWGFNFQGQAIPPAGSFKQVSAGWDYTCAIKADSTLECWGNNSSGQAAPPAGSFKQVSSGYNSTCAVKADNTIVCWGSNGYGQAPPTRAGSFKQVSVGQNHTCAIKADNTLACWGANDDTGQVPPAGSFKQVSMSGGLAGSHTCAVKADNTIACWGSNGYGQATPPAGSFKQVSAGQNHTCAIKADNTLACWGANDGSGQVPPAGSFKQVSSGINSTCAVKADNTLACWGRNDYGQAAKVGSFKQVSAGQSHSCALRADNTLACWGDNYFGKATPPAGNFKQVSAGNWHTCALKADNNLTCWC